MSTPGQRMMWIEKVQPELVGGKSTLPHRLRAEVLSRGYAAPIWMTFKQALELGRMCARARRARLSSTP